MRAARLRAVKSILDAIKEIYPSLALRVHVLKKEENWRLRSLFMSDGPRWMIEEKDYRHVYIVNPFMTLILNMGNGMWKRTMPTTVPTLYSDLIHKL